jgi:KaiC/GvpD/RAD55 family RecA-like ATPase
MLQRFHFRERDEIFILVTHYQHASSVRKKMQLAGIDTARYENEGISVILDSAAVYQPTLEESEKYYINSLTSVITEKATEGHKKGVTMLSHLGTFNLNNRMADLLSYELS